MAWRNQRKVHVARGTETAIVNIDSNDESLKFTDGQPLHIEGARNYLAIATGTQNGKDIVPIQVRTLKGFVGDIKDGVYQLSTNTDLKNSYVFSGDGNNAYINVGSNLGLELKRDNVTIASIPYSKSDSLLINSSLYLESNNI